MKFLIYTTIISLSLAGSITAARAAGVLKDAKVPHLTTTAAIPRNPRVPFAKYRFGLHVSGYPLSQLTIGIPERVRVSDGITVTDQSGQEIESSTTFEGNTAIVTFAQPVAPDTTLKVTLNGVRTSTFSSRVWLFPVTGRGAEMTTDIPLGMARIATYD
ncbi:DUF2808 domain-containing protein [Acaryochloris sp. CCMEE 5410]|uniref:DUF2808 domain-containing protein n=1 Tax=Acaryochloris sp. CCMEE 5410 TaxID=310037 RepID=UPI0002483EE0|nr:DUF2808 domain-containing protein [Acaryochloris sp. CCMEE 5410]KAI9130086.1 DUF2808 domain-containing protein [Acaryochloris sp. CCMEE 5410]